MDVSGVARGGMVQMLGFTLHPPFEKNIDPKKILKLLGFGTEKKLFS